MAAVEDLSCSECKNPFSLNGRVPKTLQCLHTFCVECLRVDFARDTCTGEDRPFVMCPAPECCSRHYLKTNALRSELKTDYFLERASSRFQVLTRVDARCDWCSVSGNDAERYCEKCTKLLCQKCSESHQRFDTTKNHPTISLEEMQQALHGTNARDPIAPFAIKKKWKCEEHSTEDNGEVIKDVNFYCLECAKMTCSDCAMTLHAKHSLCPARGVFNDPRNYPDHQYKSKIEQQLEELKKVRDEFAKALDTTNQQMEDLDRVWRFGGDSIKMEAKKMQAQLSSQRDSLMKKVESIHDTRVGDIKRELKGFERAKEEISHSLELVKSTLMCLPEEILSQEEKMIERLKQLRHEFIKHPREPSHRDIFILTVEPVDLSGAVGHVYTNHDLHSLVDGIDQVAFIQGRETVFKLTCSDQTGTPLPSSDFEVGIQVKPDVQTFSIRNNHNGTYTVTLQPRSSGEHLIYLEVQDGDEKVALDPVTVNVSPTLLQEAQVKKKIPRDQIPNMVCPAGMAVLGQNIVIADKEAHKLFVINEQGECLNVIGEEGEYEGQFNGPQGVDCDGKDLVVVADTNNHRIQIISIEGEFINEFGKHGSYGGEFIMPTDVAVSSDSQIIYVADSVNKCIQYFKMNGEMIGIFTGQSEPLLLCLGNKNRILVAECIGNQFKILSHKRNKDELQVDHCHEHSNRSTPEPRQKSLPDLEIVRSCTHKESPDEGLVQIQSIVYDSNTQYILVTEKNSPYISVFAMDGTYVGSVSCSEEDVKLASIAIFNSCALAYDCGNHVFFVLRWF